MPTLTTTSDGYVTNEPNIYSGFNDLVVGTSPGGPQIGTIQHAWIKFVPQFYHGDTLASALLDLYSWDFGNNSPSIFNASPILIRAFAEDTATIPASFADFVARSKTTAQVVTTLTVTLPNQLSTVDVTAILRELADRTGFTGQSIVLTLENDVTSFDLSVFRTIESGSPAQLRTVIAGSLPSLHFTAPPRNADFTANSRIPGFTASNRAPDFTPQER